MFKILSDGNEDNEEEFKATPSSQYQHTFRPAADKKKKTTVASSESSDEETSVYLSPQAPTSVQVFHFKAKMALNYLIFKFL